uniref:hypothetical protein n=1 Tax=Nocardia sp. A7 TaxID=2789274 RepID=UPI00397AFE3A
ARFRVLVMSAGFTVEQTNKPEPVNDVDIATISDFGIETPAPWEPPDSCFARVSGQMSHFGCRA